MILLTDLTYSLGFAGALDFNTFFIDFFSRFYHFTFLFMGIDDHYFFKFSFYDVESWIFFVL
jgi:hypothetical protein